MSTDHPQQEQFRVFPRQVKIDQTILMRTTASWPRLKVVKEGDREIISFDHPDLRVATVQLMKALATDDPDFFTGVLDQLIYAGEGRPINEALVNFKLAFIIGQNPRSQLETMMFAMMANLQVPAMGLTSDLSYLHEYEQIQFVERSATRLMRTFAELMDSVMRHRADTERLANEQIADTREDAQPAARNFRPVTEDSPASTESLLSSSDGEAAPLQPADVEKPPVVPEAPVARHRPRRRP